MPHQSIDLLLSTLTRIPANSLAALCGSQSLTYADLNQRSCRLAARLRDRGVGSEVLVGLPVEKSLDSLIGMLGIWKAGGAFVPLDPLHPLPWLKAIVREAQPEFMLAGGRPAASLSEIEVPCVTIADDDAPPSDATPVPIPRHPQTMAYCNFTSGTTGPPKGVVVADCSLVDHCRRICELLALAPGDRILQTTPLSVDAALQEILPALLVGATVVIPDTPLVSGTDFIQLLAGQQVSVVSMATSTWSRWLEHEDAATWQRPEHLRLVFVGGERVHAGKLRRWQALPWTRGLDWLTDYGPTEATISCTIWRADSQFDGKDVPIGLPIEGTRIDVLDEGLGPVPLGEVGNLWIGGDAPARGYIGRPRLTADRFRPAPSGPPGGRIYDSGDLGWRAPSGELYFAGRQDGQIKVSGIRVETGRIEELLLQCPGVRDAAVVLQAEEREEDSLLTAFVAGTDLDEQFLRTALAVELPAAMMPDRIVVLSELPRRGPADKIDRGMLERFAYRPQPIAGITAEARVRSCWTGVLGRPPTTDDEGFFAAGGDSLRALRLLWALRREFGTELAYDRISANGSVAALVAALGDHPTSRGGAALPARRPREERDGGVHPPSRGQSRLWFLHRRDPDSANYSVPLVFEVSGPVDPLAFDRALAALVSRHEALRSVLCEEGDQLRIRVLPEMIVRTTRMAASDRQAAEAMLRSEMARPFVLTEAPLIRSCLVRIQEDAHLWMINAHHTIVDAWSLDVLMAEFGALMHDEVLPPPLGQMRDQIEREAMFLAGGADAERCFWAGELGVPLPEIDLSHGARVDAGAAVGGFKPLLLDCAVARDLRHAARQHGATPFVVALSAFAATLHRWTLHDRLVIGIPSVCRDGSEDEGVVGFLTNTLPLALEVDSATPFATLVAHVAERLAAAITCQRLPLDEILEFRARAGMRGAEGLIRTMFVLQDTPLAGGLRLPGCTVREVALHNGSAKMDLTLTLRSDGEAIVGGLEFGRTALSDAEASAFGAAFLSVLRAGLRQPGLPVGALPAQPHDTMMVQTATANQACADYGRLPSLISGFLDRCRETPEAIALASRSETMTYGELERASAVAASVLAAGGVGRETLVGVCMERSIAYITAMLGILQAGGAFVPLSPAAPAERNRTIAREARLRYVVADPDAGGIFFSLPVRVWQPGELAGPGRRALAPVLPQQLAFCYFTSGSTGTPKGVAIDHRCAMSRLEWIRRRYALAPGRVLVHKTPLIFDVAIWEIFAPLLDGATVLLAGVGEEVDPLVLARFIRSETVGIHFVPSLLDAFLKSAPPASPSSLQWLQLSGEAVSPELVTRARAYFGCELHNCYGQTETSEVTCWEDDGKPLGQRVPIGSQVGIYRVFLVDGGVNSVPDGMPGEIAVSAVGGLARGYAGNPRLTAERFVPNPFARESGERLYLTGDIGRKNRDGQIELIGRADNQLKILGCRVEPGEVEQVLLRYPSVAECAVIAAPSRSGSSELVAYVTGPRDIQSGLVRHAEAHLPSYMLPAAYIRLERLPLTPSGKLDRGALPRPTPDSHRVVSASAPPHEGIETEIAEIWSQVLGNPAIGRDDSFFSAGGNSLTAIQVLSRLRARYGVNVSVRDFFARPTIAEFAPFLDAELCRFVAAMSDSEIAVSLAETLHV